jgi:hypothetical protein
MLAMALRVSVGRVGHAIRRPFVRITVKMIGEKGHAVRQWMVKRQSPHSPSSEIRLNRAGPRRRALKQRHKDRVHLVHERADVARATNGSVVNPEGKVIGRGDCDFVRFEEVGQRINRHIGNTVRQADLTSVDPQDQCVS